MKHEISGNVNQEKSSPSYSSRRVVVDTRTIQDVAVPDYKTWGCKGHPWKQLDSKALDLVQLFNKEEVYKEKVTKRTHLTFLSTFSRTKTRDSTT